MTWYHEPVICHHSDSYLTFVIEEIDIVEDHVSFRVKYGSERFAGWHVFLMHVDDVRHVLTKLKEMEVSRLGETRITDVNTDAYVEFSTVEGHINVSGILGDSKSDHMLILEPRGCSEMTISLIELLRESVKAYWYE